MNGKTYNGGVEPDFNTCRVLNVTPRLTLLVNKGVFIRSTNIRTRNKWDLTS